MYLVNTQTIGSHEHLAAWRARLPLLVVLAASSGYALVAAYFSLRRHEYYRSSFDLANFDQVLWLLSEGHEPLNTQDGRLFWGDHFSPTVVLLTPLYQLGAGPGTLLVIQAAAMALVAPLLFALARAYGAEPWLALVPALLWLLSPLTLIPNVNDFHHVPLVAPAIVGSVLALKHDRLVVFVILGVLACGAKEDVSLTYAMMGIVVALEGRRRLGTTISAVALTTFLFTVVIVIPTFSDSLEWFERRFAGSRGESFADVAIWLVTHPVAAVSDLASAENIGLCVALVITAGGLCLLASRWLLIGMPALVHNLLTAYAPQHGLRDQYQVPVSIAVAIAAAVGVHRLADAGSRARMLAVAGVTVAVLLAPVGLRHVHLESEWSAERTAKIGSLDARRSALALIPDDVPVAASTRLTPHLAHRREIYTLPLPFLGREEIGADWSPGAMSERAARVRWVVLDMNDRPTEFPRAPERIRPLLDELGFHSIFEEGTVSVWVRGRARGSRSAGTMKREGTTH